MKRPMMLLGALCFGLIACSLSGTPTSDEAAEAPASSGGVPITKSTPTPAESAPRPTQPPQAPAATPAPVSTETSSAPLPVDQDIPIEVIDLNVIDEGSGIGASLYGLVRNIGQRDLSYLQFTIDFLDNAGAVVGSRLVLMDSRILPVGEIAPFREFFPAGVEADVDLVRLGSFWKEAEPDFEWQRGGAEIINSRGNLTSYGSYLLSGEVRNTSPLRLGKAYIVGLAFDAQGHFLAHTVYNYEESIEPGASFTFVDRPIILHESGGLVATYEIIVETWTEPWPGIQDADRQVPIDPPAKTSASPCLKRPPRANGSGRLYCVIDRAGQAA